MEAGMHAGSAAWRPRAGGVAATGAGDLPKPETLPLALDGVAATFLFAAAPVFAPAFLRAATTAGVRRIVSRSSGAPGAYAGRSTV